MIYSTIKLKNSVANQKHVQGTSITLIVSWESFQYLKIKIELTSTLSTPIFIHPFLFISRVLEPRIKMAYTARSGHMSKSWPELLCTTSGKWKWYVFLLFSFIHGMWMWWLDHLKEFFLQCVFSWESHSQRGILLSYPNKWGLWLEILKA